VGRALAWVDAHLDQRLDAAELADQAAFSRFHFHRVFAAHMGCSVGTYVTWRRLQRACALLVSGPEPVLEIALEAGYESAQALAKALRREWGTSPTAVRRGQPEPWQPPLRPWRADLSPPKGVPLMNITRYAELPSGLTALTATAHGMVNHTLERAARQAFGELVPAIAGAGLMPQAWSWISLCPDDPQGPDDPNCRYVAGVIFGFAMAHGQGACAQPPVALSGTLAWQRVAAGRYAVFTPHRPLCRPTPGVGRHLSRLAARLRSHAARSATAGADDQQPARHAP
jgi:AraC family transcriptional regulator